jgi:hypothetical protein
MAEEKFTGTLRYSQDSEPGYARREAARGFEYLRSDG